MSKGLEALKSMWLYIDEPTKRQFALQDYKVIEKELTRLEELEKAFVALSKDDEKAKKLLSKEIEKNRTLEIINQNFRLIGNCLHTTNPYAETGSVFVKEIETEEELRAWKEVLS